MKIAYVGNFTQPHCTEVHLSATLKDLGHTVMELQEDGYTPQEMGNILKQVDVDLFLFTRTWGNTITLDHLAHLRERKIPSASYHLDLYVGLSRKHQFGDKFSDINDMLKRDPFWQTDFVFTPDGSAKSAEVFRANGINHFYIKPGVFKPECYMATPTVLGYGDRHEIIFVGGGERPGHPQAYGHPEWNYRNELVAWLWDTYGDSFKKFGHPQQTIRNDKLNQLYADSKVVVGDSVCLDFKQDHYWSDRVYETLGRGGFLIHPFIEGMQEEFKDGKDLVFYEYGNWAQLKEKIDYYLTHDEEREQIRAQGHGLVKGNCTYHDRLRQALGIIFDNPAYNNPIPDEPLKISLGAGAELETEPGWVNVDMLELPGIDVVHNLMNFPYPFADNSAEYIKAKDLIEHLDHYTKDGKPSVVAFVEECHRILKPGGTLWIQTPSHDADFLWIDPTHVRGFELRSMDFFDPTTDFGRSTGFYSDAKFRVTAKKLENNNLQFDMVKI